MKNRVLIVVGNRFVEFAKTIDVVTASQLFDCLQELFETEGIESVTLFPGQGLSLSQSKVISEHMAYYYPSTVKMHLWDQSLPKASLKHTHKQFQRNILIGQPNRLAENVFNLELLIDDDSELMLDHQTGSHVQGMILIEAARQTAIAVMSEYYEIKLSEKYSYTFDSLKIDFLGFVFPIESKVNISITPQNAKSNKQRSFHCEISILQGATVKCEIEIGLTLIEQTALNKLEGRYAVKSTRNATTTRQANSPITECSEVTQQESII